MSGSTIRLSAPAKVNVYLGVGDRRPDGYHDVTTVLHALELSDTVTVSEAGGFSFTCEPDLGIQPDDNLAARAARSLAAAIGRPAAVAVAVEKRIPAAAGLGGASSDAAAVLCGLCELWGLSADAPEVLTVARGLGADVPFFLHGGAALFTGRGDVLGRTLPSLDAAVVLVRPDEPVPTAAAYAMFDRQLRQRPASPDAIIAALSAGDVQAVGAALYNNLTESSVALVPAIGDALRLLGGDPGVLGQAMAGSGSATFALCDSDESADRLAAQAGAAGFWAVATRTAAAGCRLL